MNLFSFWLQTEKKSSNFQFTATIIYLTIIVQGHLTKKKNVNISFASFVEIISTSFHLSHCVTKPSEYHEVRMVPAVTDRHVDTKQAHTNTIIRCDRDPIVCVWAQGLSVRQTHTHTQLKANTAAAMMSVWHCPLDTCCQCKCVLCARAVGGACCLSVFL